VYDISYRHELLGESVPSSEKIFSIYEDHTDIIVKGAREVAFGHKVNLTTGRSNLILDCEIADGNPKDSNLYEGVLERVRSDYGIRPGIWLQMEPMHRFESGKRRKSMGLGISF